MHESRSARRLGYARVSTVGQTLEAQLEQLSSAECDPIFREKLSGARLDRKQLQTMLRTLRRGDIIVVTRIDRLARSTFDLFAIVRKIVECSRTARSWLSARSRTRASSVEMSSGQP